MRSLRVVLSTRATLTLTATHLLAPLALMTAALLLWLYLGLLNGAVERGARSRAQLLSGAGTRPPTPLESALRPERAGLVRVGEPGP